MEWAEKGGVFIDKLYSTELREGRTRALGGGVPAVAHDLLNALPEDRVSATRTSTSTRRG